MGRLFTLGLDVFKGKLVDGVRELVDFLLEDVELLEAELSEFELDVRLHVYNV